MSFLSSLLPAALGAGAVAVMGPAALPWVAGGLGAYQTLRTGDLGQGLMAGLGAYGGGQLGAALAQQGMQDAVIQEGIRNQAAQQAGFGSVAEVGQPVWKQAAESAWYDAAPGIAPDSAAMAENLGKYQDAYAALNKAPTGMAGLESAGRGLQSLAQPGGLSQLGSNLGGGWDVAKTGLATLAPAMVVQPRDIPTTAPDTNMGQRYEYAANTTTPMPAPDVPEYGNLGQDFGRQQRYFTPSYTRISDDRAKSIYGFAAGGGPVEAMSNANAIGQNTGFPQADMRQGAYATPWQTPVSRNMLTGAADTGINPISGEMNFASGGLSDLGGYSDGGRLLRGPGDGVSDSIPAVIGGKQPARLADGEFVVPARIVSELGNGSTDAGARQLYAMMDRVQKARGKTMGRDKVAKRTNPQNLLPA